MTAACDAPTAVCVFKPRMDSLDSDVVSSQYYAFVPEKNPIFLTHSYNFPFFLCLIAVI